MCLVPKYVLQGQVNFLKLPSTLDLQETAVIRRNFLVKLPFSYGGGVARMQPSSITNLAWGGLDSVPSTTASSQI